MSSPSRSTSTHFVHQQLAAGKKGNALLVEKSPYLLQHAFNPVHWLPWGDEAFQRATREEKPIFLSIGYSTCHWCHVMAHESFEDDKIAAFLNDHFIAIKVDREERPDIDQLYMTATLAIAGNGGWPMSVFLLPDRRPFYAGTYFPPTSNHGRPGFLDLLKQLTLLWHEDRARLSDHAGLVTAKIHDEVQGGEAAAPLTEELLHLCAHQAAQSFDRTFGGFGGAPKFPRPVLLDLLLRYDARQNNRQAREIVLFTLKKMAAGGIYDHLGGGFHRYSVDEQWQVPHFEKMLYDQGQLAALYFDAFQVSGDAQYRRIGCDILDYVRREMTDPQGGFYSAEDADSQDSDDAGRHGEGLFYLWSAGEINRLLGREHGAIFSFYYGVEETGNALADPLGEFTGKNILYLKNSLARTAGAFDRSEAEIESRLATARQTLFAARQQRPRPHLDDKIITAWNGLMITAMAKGFKVSGEENYLAAATSAARFIEKNLYNPADDSLFRRYREGEAHFQGQLDDYAFLIQGLLDLHSACFDSHWLRLALRLCRQQILLFTDDTAAAFFDTPATDQTLLVRMRNDYDGAEPTGNAITALNLLRLAQITNNSQWRQKGEALLAFFADKLMTTPYARPAMAAAYDLASRPQRQIVIAGHGDDHGTRQLLQVINRLYLPTTLVLLADQGANRHFLEKYLPAVQAMTALDNKATAYVCEDFTCRQPIQSADELAALLCPQQP